MSNSLDTVLYDTSSGIVYPSGLLITASLFGTSSNAVSASYALSSSYGLSSSFALTSSFALSSSYGLSSSFALTSSFALSSSYALTSSYAVTASSVVSSSQLTASNLLITRNGNWVPPLWASPGTIQSFNSLSPVLVASASIPANALVNGHAIHAVLIGDTVVNPGFNVSASTLVVNYGSATLISASCGPIGNGPNHKMFNVDIWLSSSGSASQWCQAQTAGWIGANPLITSPFLLGTVYNSCGTSSVDSTTNQTMSIYMANTTQSTQVSWTIHNSLIELI